MDLVQMFNETCIRRAGKTALVWQDRTWTWEEVRQAALRVVGGLNVRHGDRAAIFLPNSPENVFAQLGVQMAGAIRVPVNAAYTAREAAHPIRFARCSVVITDEAHIPVAQEAAADHITVQPDGEPPDVLPKTHPTSLICFTSGTSGRPKGVPLSHFGLVHNIQALTEVWEWTERDTLLLCLPLMHLHALHNGLNGWIATGCTLVLQEKFQAEPALEAIERHKATMFFGVPAMYHKILELPNPRKLPTMRLWVSGSAPLDPGLAERFEKAFGHRIVNRYGMTETAMITANPARGERRPGSVGKPLPKMDVRVFTAEGTDCKPGVTGEIVVKGPSVARSYWGDEEDDATAHRRGYFHTGDLGHKDKDGYVFITGRAKDIIISGGTNIAPVEIEEVLLKHPNVAEALAMPMADAALGEVVRAVVVPRGQLDAGEVSAWCAQHLAKFKQPRDVRIVKEPLPRNAMQKLDRKRAKELYGA